MVTFKKILPWALMAIAVGAAIYFFDRANKAKAANKSIADAIEQTNENTGIAGFTFTDEVDVMQ
jgi:hypothetical protein